jgi:hypothetical protein
MDMEQGIATFGLYEDTLKSIFNSKMFSKKSLLIFVPGITIVLENDVCLEVISVMSVIW